MAFVDDLALVEVLIGLVAVLLAYTGVLAFWAIRTNRPQWLRTTLKSSAIPIGGVGAVTMALALWTEMTWPFPIAYMGGYNIFFGDVMLLFGLVAVCFALAAYLGHHLHLVGLLALVVGIVTAFYGWTGYTANPAFTKDPYTTFLMYGAFGLAAVSAFPATIVTDYFLSASSAGRSIWTSLTGSGLRTPMGSRAAQPMSKLDTEGTDEDGSRSERGYRVHWALQLVMLAFPLLMALAAYAAFAYFATTLPGHLGAGAAKAP